MNDIRETIRNKAIALGIDAIGFGPAELADVYGERLRNFLESGYHGEMDWLNARLEQRIQPKQLWDRARSVISLGLSYTPSNDPLDNLRNAEKGNISVYARNRDYHDYFKGLIKHLAQFIVSKYGADIKVFVDTAPIMEKPLAMQAGVGWIGKHTNLVSRRFGSWLFLGEIYLDLDIPPSPPHANHCGSCSRCLDICPTRAFNGPYQLNATRCISYLTIEHRGSIPVDLRSSIGNRIYGCDDCLAVCPWNRFATAATSHAKLAARDDFMSPDLIDLSQLGEDGFRSRFSGSPIKRIGWIRFLRNILIAIGNSAASSLRPTAAQFIGHYEPVIAETAKWASDQLS